MVLTMAMITIRDYPPLVLSEFKNLWLELTAQPYIGPLYVLDMRAVYSCYVPVVNLVIAFSLSYVSLHILNGSYGQIFRLRSTQEGLTRRGPS